MGGVTLPFGYRFEHQGLLYVGVGVEIINISINPSEFERPFIGGGAFHDFTALSYRIGYSRMLTSNIGMLAELNYLPIKGSYNNDKGDSENYKAKFRDKEVLLGIFYDF